MRCKDQRLVDLSKRIHEKRERAMHLSRLEMLLNEFMDAEERGDEEWMRRCGCEMARRYSKNEINAEARLVEAARTAKRAAGPQLTLLQGAREAIGRTVTPEVAGSNPAPAADDRGGDAE